MEQEKKLMEYRAKKKRTEQIQHYNEKLKKLFSWRKETPSDETQKETLINSTPEMPEKAKMPEDEAPTRHTENDKPDPTFKFRYEFYIIFVILWIISYVIFIKLQFGTIYLIISAIFGIYFNTRTGPKDKNEISAYSVFNKNCESIDGTLKAEQFEREIIFGAVNM